MLEILGEQCEDTRGLPLVDALDALNERLQVDLLILEVVDQILSTPSHRALLAVAVREAIHHLGKRGASPFQMADPLAVFEAGLKAF